MPCMQRVRRTLPSSAFALGCSCLLAAAQKGESEDSGGLTPIACASISTAKIATSRCRTWDGIRCRASAPRSYSTHSPQARGFYFVHSYPRLIQMQDHVGGYLVAFVPKAVHLFVGMVRRSDHLLETEEVMNNTILWFQSVAQLIVLGAVLFMRRLRLSSDVVYLAVLIAAVITLSPIYSTRYLLPVYALFAVELAMPRRALSAESV